MRTEADLRAALLSLEVDAPSVENVLPTVAHRPPARRVRRWLAPVAAAAAVALIAVVAVIANREGKSSSLPAGPGWRVVTQIPVSGPGFIGYGAGSLWVVDQATGGSALDGSPIGNLYRIDPANGRVEDTIPHAIGGWPVVGEGAVWLATRRAAPEVMTRVDLRSLDVRRIHTSARQNAAPGRIFTTPSAVWVGNMLAGTVAQIDPRTGSIRKEIHVADTGLAEPGDLVGNPATIFADLPISGQIVRIDAATGTVLSRIAVPKSAWDLALDGDTLYAVGDTTVYRIDVSTVGAEKITGRLALAQQASGTTLSAQAGSGSLWVLQEAPVRLLRIDLETFDGTTQIHLPAIQPTDQRSADLTIGAGAVWLRVPGQVLEIRQGR